MLPVLLRGNWNEFLFPLLWWISKAYRSGCLRQIDGIKYKAYLTWVSFNHKNNHYVCIDQSLFHAGQMKYRSHFPKIPKDFPCFLSCYRHTKKVKCTFKCNFLVVFSLIFYSYDCLVNNFSQILTGVKGEIDTNTRDFNTPLSTANRSSDRNQKETLDYLQEQMDSTFSEHSIQTHRKYILFKCKWNISPGISYVRSYNKT